MAITKIPDSYINNQAAWLPLRTVAKKVNEIIDAVNSITGGTSDSEFNNITVADTTNTYVLEVTTNATITGTLTANNLISAGAVSVGKTLVTQSTSITTGVTSNTQTGKITTVSSTLATNTSAIFLVTCGLVNANSVVILTASTQGNGIPVASVFSVTNGSFNIRLYNAGTAALNNTVDISYVIFN